MHRLDYQWKRQLKCEQVRKKYQNKMIIKEVANKTGPIKHTVFPQLNNQLLLQQEQASATKLVNKMLLQNILPHHVAER